MDNPPAKDPKKASLLSAPRQQRKLPWDNLPGWHEEHRLKVTWDRKPGDNSVGRDINLKVYVYRSHDLIGMQCFLGPGTHGQLLTQDDPPKVYELHPPETDLILSTQPWFCESQWQDYCHWTIRLFAGNEISIAVTAVHSGKPRYEIHIPKEYSTPEIAKLYEDFSDLLKIESRAREIARRRDYPFSQWTDEEFQRHLNWEHPLPKRSPEEIQALQEAAPILHQKIKALKTWEGRKAMGLKPQEVAGAGEPRPIDAVVGWVAALEIVDNAHQEEYYHTIDQLQMKRDWDQLGWAKPANTDFTDYVRFRKNQLAQGVIDHVSNLAPPERAAAIHDLADMLRYYSPPDYGNLGDGEIWRNVQSDPGIRSQFVGEAIRQLAHYSNEQTNSETGYLKTLNADKYQGRREFFNQKLFQSELNEFGPQLKDRVRQVAAEVRARNPVVP